MKSRIKIFLICLIVFINSETKNKIGSKNKIDIIGEIYNEPGHPVMTAVSYGTANNVYIPPFPDVPYVRPEMIEKIPEVILPPGPGPLEATDEIPTPTVYYDGSPKLNAIQVKCTIHANPTDCLRNSNCGWCGSSNTCILGNNLGPLQPCVKSSYIFSKPIPNWNPQTRLINANVGGVSLSVISK